MMFMHVALMCRAARPPTAATADTTAGDTPKPHQDAHSSQAGAANKLPPQERPHTLVSHLIVEEEAEGGDPPSGGGAAAGAPELNLQANQAGVGAAGPSEGAQGGRRGGGGGGRRQFRARQKGGEDDSMQE